MDGNLAIIKVLECWQDIKSIRRGNLIIVFCTAFFLHCVRISTLFRLLDPCIYTHFVFVQDEI